MHSGPVPSLALANKSEICTPCPLWGQLGAIGGKKVFAFGDQIFLPEQVHLRCKKICTPKGSAYKSKICMRRALVRVQIFLSRVAYKLKICKLLFALPLLAPKGHGHGAAIVRVQIFDLMAMLMPRRGKGKANKSSCTCLQIEASKA